MSLTMKRYRYLIVLSILFLWVLVYFWTYRVISINIWNSWKITTDNFDIDNTIDLFDTSQVHDIKILMTEEEYKDMIDTYISTSEKDWYRTDVIIDWVTIYDVWIRLKWNSSLKWIWWNDRWWPSQWWMDRGKRNRNWGGNNMMWWYHWNMMRWWMQRNNAEEFGSWENEIPPTPLNEGGQPWMQFPWAFEWWSFGPWMMSGDSINYDSQLPLFIKFNKYDNQTYQWHEMISLRVGWMWSDSTLLAEPYSYELYQEAWQPSPDTSYWSVQIDWKDPELFIISELPEDEYYIQKWFWDDNGILYKAWNFIDFSYQWEDPTVYTDYFTQKTRINDYDFAPLIRMLKFVTESSDEEFESEIDSYIDVESVLTLLAIDDFVGNNDSFGWMWSNYYLYYHLWEKKFYILTWDQNLAFNWMWGEMWWWMGWGWFPWMWWFNMSWMNFRSFWTEGEESKNNIQDSSVAIVPQNDDVNMPTPPDFPWWWEFSWEMSWFTWWDMPHFPWWEWMWWWEWFSWWGWHWWSNKNGDNELKTRLLANEKFKAMYDEIYAEIEEIALNSDFSENFFAKWTNAFYKYNSSEKLVSKSSYSQWVEKLKSYLENKKDS